MAGGWARISLKACTIFEQYGELKRSSNNAANALSINNERDRSLVKLRSLWIHKATSKETIQIQGRETCLDVHSSHAAKRERQCKMTVGGDYANSLLNEKKKPIPNHAQSYKWPVCKTHFIGKIERTSGYCLFPWTSARQQGQAPQKVKKKRGGL